MAFVFFSKTDIKVIVTRIKYHIDDLAVSWETRDLFWSHDSSINKMTLSGGNTTTIISNLASRISVALHMRERSAKINKINENHLNDFPILILLFKITENRKF